MADNWQLKAVISANAASMLKTLKAVNVATRTTRKYLLDVASAGGNLATQVGMPLGLIGAALGALSIAGIKQAVGAFAELGDQTVKSAQRIGVSTEEYQRLKYIAGQSGVSVDELGSAMGKLNKNIGMAATGGNKDLVAFFQRAGISMRKANGELKNSTELLPEIAEQFKINKGAAAQALMGTAAFGKGYQALVPLLQGGKEGINELTERYRMLGLEIDGKALKAGEAFGDKMEDLHLVMRSYGNTISAKLIPLFGPLLENTIKWAAANREVITSKISKFIAEMADELSKVDWPGVIKSIGSFVTGLKECIDKIGGAKVALIALAVVMNAQTIVAVLGLVGSIGRASWALGVFSATHIPTAIAAMGSLAASMNVASIAAGGLLAKLGLIGAAAAAGYGIGTLLNDYVVNPGMEKMTGEKGQTLGGWIYDKTHQDPLMSGQTVKTSGGLTITFDGAPPGMRVAQDTSGNLPINTDVGYNSDFYGAN